NKAKINKLNYLQQAKNNIPYQGNKIEWNNKLNEYIDDHLSFTEKKLLELPIFLQLIEIIQNLHLYSAMCINKKINSDTNWAILPFVMPIVLEKNGGVTRVGKFSGVYDK